MMPAPITAAPVSGKAPRRDWQVFCTPSGLGGSHTVAIIEDRGGGKVLVRVCYGTFRDSASGWESWPDWDGYTFETTRDRLSRPRRLGDRL